ncbi:hypothetical protein [Gilliamella sp. Lep-s35]|uniref:hypothetical protein n=1 Tax=Gilliamella sp. Lep-s35 TaxID=2687312 RepID=UPI00136645BE|nr:hypothetical protein [Gilliamella sp. Lep-s35]MWP50010.1 hypothetical protein [Gilliamella sp. Lep-s35]
MQQKHLPLFILSLLLITARNNHKNEQAIKFPHRVGNSLLISDKDALTKLSNIDTGKNSKIENCYLK